MFPSSLSDVFRLRRGIDSLFDQLTTDWPGVEEFGPNFGPPMAGYDQGLLPASCDECPEVSGREGREGTQLAPAGREASGQMTSFDPFQMTGAMPLKIDIIDNEKTYEIRADVPGVNRDGLKVKVKDRRLTIEAERSQEHEEKRKNFRRVERSWGKTQRTILLPRNVDANAVKARLGDNGELHIEIPKLPEVPPKFVPIEAGVRQSLPQGPSTQPQTTNASPSPSKEQNKAGDVQVEAAK
jgi:HSP20 family protein